ncbi:primosomal replication protein N [Sutterella sp.]|uniref:primosomal replication protein N n=1 Tax=Sutterella sp. TaxID=1981025 RepID=UPI0026E03F40|nr:primosomal replication protein N [Sutterella sp.]MDO5531620.1 primosomal replication protein N [Sutterella sp.]
MNSIVLSGTLIEREAVRFTPAGIEVFEAVFHHRSELIEAGRARRLECDFDAVSYGEPAGKLNSLPIGAEILMKGFIAPRSTKSRRLVVHITEFK